MPFGRSVIPVGRSSRSFGRHPWFGPRATPHGLGCGGVSAFGGGAHPFFTLYPAHAPQIANQRRPQCSVFGGNQRRRITSPTRPRIFLSIVFSTRCCLLLDGLCRCVVLIVLVLVVFFLVVVGGGIGHHSSD